MARQSQRLPAGAHYEKGNPARVILASGENVSRRQAEKLVSGTSIERAQAERRGGSPPSPRLSHRTPKSRATRLTFKRAGYANVRTWGYQGRVETGPNGKTHRVFMPHEDEAPEIRPTTANESMRRWLNQEFPAGKTRMQFSVLADWPGGMGAVRWGSPRAGREQQEEATADDLEEPEQDEEPDWVRINVTRGEAMRTLKVGRSLYDVCRDWFGVAPQQIFTVAFRSLIE